MPNPTTPSPITNRHRRTLKLRIHLPQQDIKQTVHQMFVQLRRLQHIGHVSEAHPKFLQPAASVLLPLEQFRRRRFGQFAHKDDLTQQFDERRQAGLFEASSQQSRDSGVNQRVHGPAGHATEGQRQPDDEEGCVENFHHCIGGEEKKTLSIWRTLVKGAVPKLTDVDQALGRTADGVRK